MRLEDLDPSADGRLVSPSAERNKEPIAQVLLKVLPKTGVVLEIGSGTGQHVTPASLRPCRAVPAARDRSTRALDAGTCDAVRLARRRRAVERVKEAVALAPSDKWNVAKLADVANLSAFHLCRVFRQMVGSSIYDYVLRERLAHTLDAVLDGGDDITAIALDAGFASHSHFTARFRSFFGCTPTALRRIGTAERATELRKIMTARRRRLA